jgi:hypothetical protein
MSVHSTYLSIVLCNTRSTDTVSNMKINLAAQFEEVNMEQGP